MKRRGRRRLPKIHGSADARSGFEHGAYTVEGTVSRMGAFSRGWNERGLTRRQSVRFGLAFAAIVGLFVAGSFVRSWL
jgi:hypothetical protein